MPRLLAILLAMLLAGAAAAQSLSDRAARLLEEQLSGPGRTVQIEGFVGAITSQARLERMTIADGQGVWLVLEGATLDWTASALVQRRVQVDVLRAQRLELRRAPIAEDSLPAAESSGFRIPDLPVAINIGTLEVAEIILGAPLLGEEVTADLTASAALDAGALDVTLGITRTNGAGGQADIVVQSQPEGGALTLQIGLTEPAGGVAARVLGLPDLPSVSLNVQGAGPLDDYATVLSLATDGTERVAGTVRLEGDGQGGRRFRADLGGDIRPLLTPDNRAFFGDDTRVIARGAAAADGALVLEDLRLRSARFDLTGRAALEASGAPQSFALTGQVQPGRLPGSEVQTEGVNLTLGFDAAQGPDWAFDLTSPAIALPGARLGDVALRGRGVITPGGAEPFAGTVALDVAAIALDDAQLAQAVGQSVQVQTGMTVAADGRVDLTDLTARTDHISLQGAASATPSDGRIALAVEADADLPEIDALGPLVAPVQAGALRARVQASADLPGGAITMNLTGQSEGLDLGIAQLAPLLLPESALTLSVTRDGQGTRLEEFEIENPELTANGSGTLTSDGLRLAVNGRLADMSRLQTGLPSAPVDLTVTARGPLDGLEVAADLRDGVGTDVDLRAVLGSDAVRFDADVQLPDVTSFSGLTAPLRSGAARANLSGQFDRTSGDLIARLMGQTSALDLGIAALEPFLTPETDIDVTLDRTADGALNLRNVVLSNAELAVTGAATLAEERLTSDLNAQLSSMTRLLPDLPNAQLTATAQIAGPLDALAVDARVQDAFGSDVLAQVQLGEAAIGFTAQADLPNVSPYARLTAPLQRGAATAQASGQFTTDTGDLSVELTGQTQALDLGIAQIAPLIRPATRIELALERAGDGTLTVRQAALRNPELSATATARLQGEAREVNLTARLTDIRRIVPNLGGAVSTTASLRNDTLRADVASASGLTSSINGRIGLPGGAVDLDARGRLPLGLAQPFLGQRSLTGSAAYDLSLRGQPGLDALAGTVTTGDLRLADPALGFVLDRTRAQIGLSGGRAQVDLNGALNDAPLQVAGGVTLSAPFATDITAQLQNMAFAFEDLARTRITAGLRLSGAAQTQLAVVGDVSLADTEIRVPDSGLSGAGTIPVVRHIGAPPQVRRTLSRAGLLDRARSSGGTGLRLPLDVNVTAIDPIFVRGRGLDAEFGGSVRIGGTAASPEPVGRFELRRGRLALLGQRLDLTEGSITAAGSLIPLLRIVAEADTGDVTARIILDGPANAPELILSSDPELPQDEVLARLLFGRDVASLSAFQVARLISSLATLSSGKPGLLENTRLLFGVDDLDIRTDARTGETQLAIGNYISENVYSEVEIGSQNSQINLNLDLTDTARLRGSVNQQGDTGIGIFWEKDY